MAFADALAEAVKATEARILCIDIETRPHLIYAWSLFDLRVGLDQIVEHGSTICWAAKWYGEPTVMFASVHHDGYDEMIAEAWRLLDSADIVVGYNHRAFDLKHLHREFVKVGYGPPSPHRDIDLLTVARRRFKFTSNKLDNVAAELEIGRKLPHAGFQLWRDCMDGDAKAWGTMRRYCKHDVVLTEQLYDRLRPWVPGHPNLNLYRGITVSGCHACGSSDLEDAGFKYTATRAYAQFRCTVCGAYSQTVQASHARHRKGST